MAETEVVLEEAVKADRLLFQRSEPTIEVLLQRLRQLDEAVAQTGELEGHGVERVAQLVGEDPSVARSVLEAGVFAGELEEAASRPGRTEVIGEVLEGLARAGLLGDRTPGAHRERSDDLVTAADRRAAHSLDAQQAEQIPGEARVFGCVLEADGLPHVEAEQRAVLARIPGEIEAREVGGVDANLGDDADPVLHGVIAFDEDEVEAGDVAELASKLFEHVLAGCHTIQQCVQARRTGPPFRGKPVKRPARSESPAKTYLKTYFRV